MPEKCRTYFTPPEIAASRGIGVAKVLHFIHSGQLAAINMARDPNGRPRFRVSIEALRAFEESRQVRPEPRPRQRRRRRQDIIEYF